MPPRTLRPLEFRLRDASVVEVGVDQEVLQAACQRCRFGATDSMAGKQTGRR